MKTHHLGRENRAEQPPRLPPKLHVGLAALGDVEVQRTPRTEAEGDYTRRKDAECASGRWLGLPSCGLVRVRFIAQRIPHPV